MKKRLITLLLLLAIILSISGCSNVPENSRFEITFINVGQGDSALVECDGHFMLIDGGDTDAADDVDRILKDRMSKANTTTLDVLVASHLHEDHIGGLIEGLNYVRKIKYTLSNAKTYDSEAFDKFNQRVHALGSRIKVPKVNATYNLGSAKVYVIDVKNEKNNDSVVLLIAYGHTTFLFTGDIEKDAQKRVADKLRQPEFVEILKTSNNMVKMPHHGGYNSNRLDSTNFSNNYLYSLLDAAYAKYFVISVGEGNKHDHPHDDTLKVINQAMNHELDPAKHLFRTDSNGNITVTSDGTTLTINTEKSS